MSIHPSAIISETAQIGQGCIIGPYCVVGDHVKLGASCNLHSHVVLDGHLTIGDGCELYPFCCIGKQTQDLKFAGETTYVTIGNNNILREYVTVNSSTAAGNTTIIGNDCFIQSYCHIAHECRLGNNIIMSGGTLIAGHCEIDDSAIIGGNTGITQFVRIGALAMIGACSKLSHDVLPYSIADGIPAEMRAVNKIGLQRSGRSDDAVKNVSYAFKKLLLSNLSLDDAIDIIRGKFTECPEIDVMLSFVAQGSRPLARPKSRG